ncbi:hypothetical protein HanRHA438_Chr07g0320981 [Helianthus annuus]|nr:hypothetical protein HanRHA438_Chr07g0320981 [Helianthus annuus]
MKNTEVKLWGMLDAAQRIGFFWFWRIVVDGAKRMIMGISKDS